MGNFAKAHLTLFFKPYRSGNHFCGAMLRYSKNIGAERRTVFAENQCPSFSEINFCNDRYGPALFHSAAVFANNQFYALLSD
jgi:hypothetical protein